MDQLQLYINDQLVDLNEDSPIALSFQINNLADVRNQQGNTSNQFKVPLTQRNRQILGFPDNVAFASDLPYKKYDAKVIQDGLEIIPYGIAELNSTDNDNASITILSGNVDFFDLIDGRIYDMGDKNSPWGKDMVWQPYDHKWDLINVAHSQTKTDGWIWPIVDYGLFQDTEDAAIIDVRHMRPGFFIKTAIDLLLKSTGYKGTGSLLADPLYPLLICQFSNNTFDHGINYQTEPDKKEMNASQPMDVQLNHFTKANPGGNFSYSQIDSDPSNQFIGSTYFKSDSVNNITVTATFPHVKMYGYVTPVQNASKLTAYIIYHRDGTPNSEDLFLAQHTFGFDGFGEKKPGDPHNDPNGWTRISGSGGNIFAEIDIYKTKISVDAELGVNDIIYIGYVWTGKVPTYATFYKGNTLEVVSQKANVKFGQDVQCERIFPDISQKDLLKDTLQRFGIICQTDNNGKTISFNSFRDIVNNIPIAKNWTSKCVDQGKQITFQLGNYAQVNYLQYKHDDNVLPAKFGWSQINIANQTLPASSTLFESLFGVTLNRPFYGGQIAQIKMVDNTDGGTDFMTTVEPRILIDQKLDLQKRKQTITFTDGVSNIVVNDYISTPYFYKPDAPDLPNGYGKPSLHFDDLRKKYYPELEEILTETKKVIRYILLTPRDILELDLLIPIYMEQDSAYYYINKIDSWRKGHPTKVELVKLG
ncbi:MAG: hypothetical protein EOP47_04580 [Sphingobacteriaceae bacterium]|nr:MAG: hypothetical protein EOP47_04580 [Sphingobacteriaceae bacterium]